MSYLLLEDGTSHLLLEDGSGAVILEAADVGGGTLVVPDPTPVIAAVELLHL